MTKIVRTPQKATGGITDKEREAMKTHADLWIKRAFRTDPIEPEKIIPAIEGLYEAAGLKKPRVVIAPSPIVMVAAYGASSAIWHNRKSSATFDATDSATFSATFDATDSATVDATDSATDSATFSATRRATDSAADSATFSATRRATRNATRSATDSATDSATRSATFSATDSATGSATFSATRRATRNATRSATDSATDSATGSATFSATRRATRNATRSATGSATVDATVDATFSATFSATDSATRSATDSATDSATVDATDSATVDATFSATVDATVDATDSATRSATFSATDSATGSATVDATVDATDSAFFACLDIAGKFGLECAKRWSLAYQGGNMWAGYPCYLSAARDILGLDLPEHQKYYFWEQAAIHGGFRVLHEEFCIVSDFPVHIKVDENNEPHCENGPSHLWRDGTAFYFWHGTQVPGHWIEDPEGTDPNEVLRAENVEQRAAGCAILGWARMSEKMNRRVIDGDPESDIGALVELSLEGLPDPGRFLMAKCPRNGIICEGVPRTSDIDGKPIETAIAAQAWRDCLPQDEYTHAAIRT